MDKEQFGIWLNGKRKEKGMTQAELAEKLNYTKQMVSKWELGKGIPKNDVLSRIEEIFGPLPDDYKELHDYQDFIKLSEVIHNRQYRYMFDILVSKVKIDSMFAESIRVALYHLLWTALYIYVQNGEKREALKEYNMLTDWDGFNLDLSSFILDRDDAIIKNVGKKFEYESKSKIKRKLEILMDKAYRSMENGSFSLENDTFEFMRKNACLESMERLYNMLPNVDTSWKSSFIASAYDLSSRISDVYLVTSGLQELLQEESVESSQL